MQTHAADIAASTKVLAGTSGLTFLTGAWTWLGDNQSEIGALASMVGIFGVLISIWRGRSKD